MISLAVTFFKRSGTGAFKPVLPRVPWSSFFPPTALWVRQLPANDFTSTSPIARALLQPAALGLRVAAAVTAFVIIAITGLTLPFATLHVPVLAPFLPMFATAVVLLNGLTALLTATHATVNDDPFLGGIAGSYGFAAIIVAAQLLVFPGVFSATGLLGAGPQSAVFLWACWHLGFSALMILALAARWAGNRIDKAQRALLARRMILLGPMLALCCVGVATGAQKWLPELISPNGHVLLNHGRLSLMIITGLGALSGITLATRLEHRLGLCIALALLANVGNAVIAAAGPGRFNVGWYIGHMLSLVSSSVVFSALLHEIVGLYHQQCRLNLALEVRALQDGLTGVNNKSYFLEQFPRELMRAQREAKPLALLMVDIDHFKHFNDAYGHVEGDACIKRIATVIRAAARRASDFVVRFGGEEFAVVLPGIDAAGARRQAEALCRAVRDLGIMAAEPDKVVTISIGAAVFDGASKTHPQPSRTLLQAADRALYAAKAAGRNRWHFAAPEQELAADFDPEAGVLWQLAPDLDQQRQL